MSFERNAIGALNSFQRPADRIGLTAEHLQLRAPSPIHFRLIRTSKPAKGQPAKIERSRIATAAIDGLSQLLMGDAIVPCKISMYAAAIQLFQ
jgi:hypothetical protein